MDFETISRRESRKRRRLSERRRLFSNNLGQQQQSSQMSSSINNNAASRSGSIGMQQDNGSDFYTSRSDSPIGGDQQRITMKIQFHMTVAPDNEPLILDNNHTSALIASSLLDSPPTTTAKPPPPPATTLPSIGDQIQEKLNISRQNSTASKNGGSTRRRQQRLVTMHKSTATGDSGNYHMDTPSSPDNQQMNDDPMAAAAQSDDNLLVRHRRDSRKVSLAADLAPSGGVGHTLPPVNGGGGGQVMASREVGARSSTITDGMADEATVQFLRKTGDHHQRPSLIALNSTTTQRYNSAANLSTSSPAGAATPPPASGNKATGIGSANKERIYFKRDGQRFGHEFTLKLAVDRTYRCLLKVRPLIPLQSISIQGHQLLFVDCSQQPTTGIGGGGGGGGGSAPSSTNSSTIALNHHQQRLRSDSANAVAVPATRHLSQPVNDAYLNKHHHLRNNHQHNNHHHHNHNHNHHHHHNHNHHHQNHHHQANHLRSHPINNNSGSGGNNKPGLYHAQTTGSLATTAPRASLDRSSSPYSAKLIHLAESTSLYCQQQNQMMRHFAASYCSSSNSHLGNQLIYMFDWPASRFEVNKNKNRTQIQTVLKFKNGQILSLPLQVKFYQSDCRQHLEWGSQLHFIDYDCQINQLGQISVDRTQYY